jgi:hypothetical protein
MICVHCEEPVLPGDTFDIGMLPNLQNIHRECAVRMIAGSVAHQRRECFCYGGIGEDDPALTRRQSAKLAYMEAFRRRDPNAANAAELIQ